LIAKKYIVRKGRHMKRDPFIKWAMENYPGKFMYDIPEGVHAKKAFYVTGTDFKHYGPINLADVPEEFKK